MRDLPGVDPDGKAPGGLEIAGNVEAGSATIAGAPLVPATDATGSLRVTTGGHDLKADNVNDAGIQSYPNGEIIIRRNNDSSYPVTFDNADTDTGPAFKLRMWNVLSSVFGTILSVNIYDTTKDNNYIDWEGSLIVRGSLECGDIVTRAIGTYTGKSLAIYDVNDTLVGYAPLYSD